MKEIVFTFLLVTVSNCIFSQQPNLNSDDIISSINYRLGHWSEYLNQDKVYLHTDKAIYAQKDTIWFKAYIKSTFNGFYNHKPSNLYIELIGQDSSIQYQIVSPVIEGEAKGQIIISDFIPIGKYQLRAFTSLMKNYGQNLAFFKPIEIVGYNSFPENHLADDSLKIDIQFLPEGGHSVVDITSRIAFKAINTKGHGVDLQGTIFDQSGDSVTSFQTFHKGMGSFFLKLRRNTSYFAIIKDIPGKFELPQPLNQAYHLSVLHINSNDLKLIIQSTVANSSEEFYLMAIHNNQLIYQGKLKLNNGIAIIKLPKQNFPPGITHFTIFDQTGIPRAERLVLLKGSLTKLDVFHSTEKLKPRQKVTLIVSNETSGGSYSVSVTDALQYTKGDYDQNIVSELMLSSELSGYIEDPFYYFTSNDLDTERALDLVMLTHGWKRYNWGDIMEEEPVIVDSLQVFGFGLSGKVLNKKGRPSENINISLLSLDDNPFIAQTSSNSLGEFRFSNISFEDSLEVALKTTNKNGKKLNLNIYLNSSFPKYGHYNHRTINTKLKRDYFKKAAKKREEINLSFDKSTIVLDAITVEEKGYSAGNRKLYLEPDLKYDSSNILPGKVMNTIRTIPQVRIVDSDGEMDIQFWRGTEQLKTLILLNGMPLEPAMLKSISSNEIESIDILSDISKIDYYETQDKLGRVIAINTKNPVKRPIAGVNNYTLKGFTSSIEFYAPKYTSDNNPVKPDYRSTILWNPNLTFDRNGKLEVSFYNSNLARQLQVVIEGIDSRGRPVYFQQIIGDKL